MKDKFEYSYIAPDEDERMEIESIRRSYVDERPSETDMDKLKKLDIWVRRPPKIFAGIFGVIGILVFGLGFTFILEWNIFAWGMVLSAVGAITMAVNYPIYKAMLSARRKKYGAEIIALSDKILGNDDKK